MHASTITSLLLALSTTVTASTWFGGKDQAALMADPDPVPGDNPLTFCGPTDDYIAEIDKVDLTPNPPQAGKNLTILASGTLKEDVEKGAFVHITVKYGVIRILNTEADLCDYAEEADLECPVKKGKLALSKVVALPKEIPPGRYTVQGDVYLKDRKTQVTCFDAAVSFNTGS